MNVAWLCITSVFVLTRVICDQTFDLSRISGRFIQLFCFLFFWGGIISRKDFPLENCANLCFKVEIVVKFEC